MALRPAHVNDARALTELALRSKSSWPYSKDYLEKCKAALKVDEEYIKKWPVYVLEKNEQAIGFYSFCEKDSKFWLDHFWIEPLEMGKSFGRELFSHALSLAKEKSKMPFFIIADPFALKFYLKMGCRHIGFEKSQVLENLELPLLEVNSL